MAHYYDTQGRKAYTVPKADGTGERDTTITDARKLKLVPSVTTVLKQLSKESLGRWKQLKLLDIVEKFPHMVGKTEKWKDQLIAMSNEDTGSYSRRGSEIHDKLEKAFTGALDLETDVDKKIIQACIQSVHTVKKPSGGFKPELSFSHELGFGGQVDLYITHGIIIDFKTRQGSKLDGKTVYDDYVMQLAAYRLGVNKEARCFNLLISVTHPGVVYLHEWSKEELDRAEQMFLHLLAYWKLANKYDSSFGTLSNGPTNGVVNA